MTEATGPSGAAVSYTAAAGGADPPVPSCSPASGTVFPLGQNPVTCAATNTAGTTTGAFAVTVRDTTRPVVTTPAAVNAMADRHGGAAVR